MYQGIDMTSKFARSAVCFSGDGLCAAAGLSRPWRDLERLDLLLLGPSLGLTPNGGQRCALSKFAPGEFVTQVVATATTFTPERRRDVRSLRQHPEPLMQHAG
jgi:hypothetical protein